MAAHVTRVRNKWRHARGSDIRIDSIKVPLPNSYLVNEGIGVQPASFKSHVDPDLFPRQSSKRRIPAE